jgi:hypothetical protein
MRLKSGQLDKNRDMLTVNWTIDRFVIMAVQRSVASVEMVPLALRVWASVMASEIFFGSCDILPTEHLASDDTR